MTDTKLMLYNTMSRKKDEFRPFDPENVRMYVCGPTVYDYAHIGNARPFVLFDLLYRLLRHVYGESHVIYARNITDIDDKILTRAAEEGKTIAEISERYEKVFHQDMERLHTLPPDMEPHATDHLPEMISMMEKLIEQGHAYEAEGHVLFDVPSMAHYGRLSKRPMKEMLAGARVEVAPYKRNPTDFVMWKPSTGDQAGWDSPWGRGRPGWHLECSCMIKKHLGDTIDIHGGGLDLIFPHHENELAQSECANEAKFVGTWMHNGYLTFSGEKMSKSIGNVKTIHGLLEQYGNKGAEALRLTLLSAHYRQPLDFSDEIVGTQMKKLNRWQKITRDVEAAADVPPQIIEALFDDLNTPKALAKLSRLAKDGKAAELKAGAQFMGLLMMSHDEWFKGDGNLSGTVHIKFTASGTLTDAGARIEATGASTMPSMSQSATGTVRSTADQIDALVAERIEARKTKDFVNSDRLRDELKALGVKLLDKTGGSTDWEWED